MKTQMTSTKVQVDGRTFTLKDKIMKSIIAVLGLSAFSISANAAEVYNFYFQKPAGQEAATAISGEAQIQPTQIAATPPPAQATVTATPSVEKKEEFKRFRVNAGFAAMKASQSDSSTSCYDYSGEQYCYNDSYDYQGDFTGLQISGKYNFNKYFGVELGLFEGSAENGKQTTNAQSYGLSINTNPDSEKFQFELSAKNVSVSNSNIKNRLSLGARFTYNFNPSNGVSIETMIMDFKGRNDRSNSYYALSYVFYL